MDKRDMWPMPTVVSDSATRTLLDDRVQDVIDGNVYGVEACDILRAALNHYYVDLDLVDTRAAMIDRAERALVYGPGIGKRPARPTPKVFGGAGPTSVSANLEASRQASEQPGLPPGGQAGTSANPSQETLQPPALAHPLSQPLPLVSSVTAHQRMAPGVQVEISIGELLAQDPPEPSKER